MERDETIELLERAMAGVSVIECPRCKGEGEIGAVTLRIPCPLCWGSKVTTTRRLEVGG